MVTVVDLKSGEATAEIPVGVEPEGMGVSPDGKTIVNTSETTNMAHFIDAETFEIRGNVLVDQRPRIAEFTADGEEVWVSAAIGGTVSVLDPESLEVTTKISLEVAGLQPAAPPPVGVRILEARRKASVAPG